MIRNEDQNGDIFLNGWEALANSIVLVAADDFRKNRKKLLRNPDDPQASRAIRELEKFFRSRWFGLLSDVDGCYILDQLKAEDLNPKKRKKSAKKAKTTTGKAEGGLEGDRKALRNLAS